MAVFGRPIGDYGVETDFYGDFVTYAHRWMAGEPSIMNGFRGPFYYLVLGALSGVFGNAFLVGKLLSALSAAAVVRLSGGLLRSLAGPAVGLVGALFLAANPRFVEYSFRAGTDLLFLFLFVSVLALLLSSREPGLPRWILAGALAGAAWLTRYNGFVLLPAGIVAAAIAVRPWTRALRLAAVYCGVWLLVMAPWAIFLWHETGNPFWNTAYQNIAIEVFTSDPGLAQNGGFMRDVGFRSLGEIVGADPGRFWEMAAGNLVHHLGRDARELVSLPWAAAAIAGLVLGARRWATRRGLAFGVIGLGTYLSLLVVFYSPRFSMPLLPWWAAAMGGWGALAAGLRNRFGVRGPLWAAAGILAALAIAANAREIAASHDLQNTTKACPIEIRKLAEEAKEHWGGFTDRTPVAARKPHIGYYLGCPVMPVPTGTLDNLQRSGAHYLLVSGAEVSAYPGLAPLWVPGRGPVPKELRLVTSVAVPLGDGKARVATLYAVNDPAPWAPPPRPRFRDVREVIDGLSRLDTLRLKLARWYLRWETDRSIPDLVAHMSRSAREHPQVRLVLGDYAFRNRDWKAAESRYREVLEEVDDPAPIEIRLAGLYSRFASADSVRFEEAIEAYLATRPDAAPDDPGWWEDLGVPEMAAGRYTQAVAPFTACIRLNPESAGCWRGILTTFIGLEWEKERDEALARYRELRPGDREFGEGMPGAPDRPKER